MRDDGDSGAISPSRRRPTNREWTQHEQHWSVEQSLPGPPPTHSSWQGAKASTTGASTPRARIATEKTSKVRRTPRVYPSPDGL